MKEKLCLLVYDCEIIRAIPPPAGQERLPGIEYCKGWEDHENMGISVIGAYDYQEQRYRVFLQDNFNEFQRLLKEREILVGFNNINFDDKLIAANGFRLPVTEDLFAFRSYDLLREIWRAAGSDPDGPFKKDTQAGFGLDACGLANFGCGKTGDGANAAVDWQRGLHGRVIDYCINDVILTKRLLDQVLRIGVVFDPRGHYREIPLKVRGPFDE